MDQGKPPGAMGQPNTGRGQRANWSAAAGAAEGDVDHGRTQNIAAFFGCCYPTDYDDKNSLYQANSFWYNLSPNKLNFNLNRMP